MNSEPVRTRAQTPLLSYFSTAAKPHTAVGLTLLLILAATAFTSHAQASPLSCPQLFAPVLKTQSQIVADYQRTQEQFNMEPFPSTQERFANLKEGQLSYWDVDPASLNDYHVIGRLEGTPFEGPHGKIRLYAHYGDGDLEQKMRHLFGPPTGAVRALTQTSGRTVMLDGGRYANSFLKFSGSWFSPEKDLPRDHVLASVARSQELTKDGDTSGLLLEPAGVMLRLENGQELNIIYRESHFANPSAGHISDGDTLMALHVLLSRSFLTSPDESLYFSSLDDQVHWLHNELAPNMARFLMRSFFDFGTHFEPHSQNIDLVLDQNLHIKLFFVRDLLDVADDPMLRIAIGKSPVHREQLTKSTLINDAAGDNMSGIEYWYSNYMGWIWKGIENLLGPKAAVEYNRQLTQLLRNEFRHYAAIHHLRGLEKYPEFTWLQEPLPRATRDPSTSDRFVVEQNLIYLRELFIKHDIETHFKENIQTKSLINAAITHKQFISSSQTRGQTPAVGPNVRYGFYRGRPIRVQFAPDGKTVLDYTLPFKANFS